MLSRGGLWERRGMESIDGGRATIGVGDVGGRHYIWAEDMSSFFFSAALPIRW